MLAVSGTFDGRWMATGGMSYYPVGEKHVGGMLWIKNPVVSTAAGVDLLIKGTGYCAYYEFNRYEKGTFLKTISSENREEYPEDGVKDGKWYVWKGMM